MANNATAPAPATLGKKTIRKFAESLYPPSEIRDNTKARRAWLAAEAERINGLPGKAAKVVGQGSYQSVSVYSVTEVAGRIRHRGTCQICGNAQVVNEYGRLVLHGYKRPGWGNVVGDCPGTGKKPLNVEKELTEAALAGAIANQTRLSDELAAAKIEVTRTLRALYPETGERFEQYAGVARPARPAEHELRRMPVAEATAKLTAYRAARKEWAERYPLTAAHEKAEAVARELADQEWRARAQRDFYRDLLARNIYGTPLAEEIVAD